MRGCATKSVHVTVKVNNCPVSSSSHLSPSSVRVFLRCPTTQTRKQVRHWLGGRIVWLVMAVEYLRASLCIIDVAMAGNIARFASIDQRRPCWWAFRRKRFLDYSVLSGHECCLEFQIPWLFTSYFPYFFSLQEEFDGSVISVM